MASSSVPPTNVRFSGEMKFHFEKANFFRVIHVDGAFGGLSPTATGLQMSLYSERAPIPKEVVHQINNGVMGPEILDRRIVRDGVFREVEATLNMSLDVAISMRDWLSGRIDELRAISEQIKSI
jgi:hypothetical protein